MKKIILALCVTLTYADIELVLRLAEEAENEL